MPNWCTNSVVIGGDKKTIDAFENFLEKNKGKEWFSFFLPLPEDQKESWYEWSIENWGCKWNCDALDWERIDDSISFWFDSPWAPPVRLYEHMNALGYDVDAHYLEEGMGFVGRFLDGDDDNYKFDLSEENSLDEIPEEIVEHWDLKSRQEDYLDEQEELDDE